MNRSKDAKGSKDAKRTRGPQDLRIPSPLSPELDRLVYDVIGAAMNVHSALGPGLLEGVYADAFAVELETRGYRYERDVPVDLVYAGKKLRRYRLDLIVERQVIVELKTVTRLLPVHSAQIVTYLRLTELPVGLILNFHKHHLRNGIRRHIRRTTSSSAENVTRADAE
jgi:GxxExxY protein